MIKYLQKEMIKF